ncbi:MAG TPA: hypothetical protein PKB09_04000 [Candidatus Saccharibacteria bacterium]|nr:hypothetical protein [Candidatus Saccharibacteria bacterium]
MAKDVSDKSEDKSSGNIKINDGSNDMSSEPDLDKTKTLEEVMNEDQKPTEAPDADTKEMISAETEIEDDVLAGDVSEDLHNNSVQKSEKKSGSGKKALKILLVIILLAGIGFAAWYYLVKNKDTNSNNVNQQPTQQVVVPENTNTPDTVVYAYHEKDTDPYTLYWRPAEGGERSKIATLSKNEVLNQFDVQKNVVAYSTDTGINVSTDGGRTFSPIVEFEKTDGGNTLGDQVTSLQISKEGSKIVYGFLEANTTEGNEATAVNLDGSDKEVLFTSKKVGVFIEAYSEKANKMVYWEGCYNCDGNFVDLKIRNLETNKDTTIEANLKNTVYGSRSFAISDDFSTLVAAQGIIDTSTDGGLGIALTGPFTINKYDLKTLDKTQIATVGSKNEKNANGTPKFRDVLVGFVAGSNTSIYYTDDESVYTSDDGSQSTMMFSANNNILFAPFIGTDSAIAGSGEDTSDYLLTNYDVTTKKTTKIFAGDNNTIIMGVATK